MSGEEDLYLHQSEAEALFFSDVLLDNADELNFEAFGDVNGLDDGTFNSIAGSDLTAFETRDIFKSSGLNGDSFVDEVEARCDANSVIQQEVAGNGAPYLNGTLHTNYGFNKPTLDLENISMAYGMSGLYAPGNGVTGMGSPSRPTTSQAVSSVLVSPAMAASEKLNGLTLSQMAPPYRSSSFDKQTTASVGFSSGMVYPSTRAVSSAKGGTKQFTSSSQPSPDVHMVTSQPATNGMSRFVSQEMSAAENKGLPPINGSSSPVLSPSSSDGKEHVERIIGCESGMKMSQEKQYCSMQEGAVDTDSFVDQVDGDGDGLQPLPQMTRPSMQRSYSSHALGQLRHIGSALPSMENGTTSRHSQIDRRGGLTSPGARLQPNLAEFQSIGMRRVYSAGDIQTLNGMQSGLKGSSSPSFDDGNYRVGKYSLEERKIRITRYQQKRSQRNFNKKIKYACRKTLADSRPRVRGRFAKNMDDDIPTALLGRKREDDEDEEGDAHVGEGTNGFLFGNSSGDYSDILTSIKKEHRTVNSM
ncbi:uncharacterized protein [Physcomitrium patens]|uniref:CCT domain-containing protein n=2 Tax=Physcomitrium patens TaxID=3218 RepID=A0A2K1KX63_PHYPA|nr:uncharacterized protein LOC112279320 isoform X2 [Physcomitrium patens]PNR58373.1 hypothetical protein PHYPA_005368 [Physcomitrium patens]|eukprot:XP_024369421.1 uncharacterized protein LOC112279320 isoform X2 [Physcomitrella patens]